MPKCPSAEHRPPASSLTTRAGPGRADTSSTNADAADRRAGSGSRRTPRGVRGRYPQPDVRVVPSPLTGRAAARRGPLGRWQPQPQQGVGPTTFRIVHSIHIVVVSEFMFINHESDHFQKEKLVVSPAFNQVIQSPLDRLLRVS